MAEPKKVSGVCPECRREKLVLSRVEQIPGFPKEYTYSCPNCGYRIIEKTRG